MWDRHEGQELLHGWELPQPSPRKVVVFRGRCTSPTNTSMVRRITPTRMKIRVRSGAVRGGANGCRTRERRTRERRTRGRVTTQLITLPSSSPLGAGNSKFPKYLLRSPV